MFKGWKVMDAGFEAEPAGFELPPHQMPLLRDAARRWAALAAGCGGTIDPVRARRGVELLYRLADRQPPSSIVLADGPHELRSLAATELRSAPPGTELSRCNREIRGALLGRLRPFGPEPEVRYVDSFARGLQRRIDWIKKAAWPGTWNPGTTGLGQLSWSLNAFSDLLCRIGALRDPVAAAWLDFASCGVWDCCLLPQLAVLCPPPATVAVDEADRLHSVTGPALAWPDGTRAWYVHGVEVDGEGIEHPERLTARNVLRQGNVEVRRVLIDLMGRDRFMTEAHPTILDHDVDRSGMPRWLMHGPGMDTDAVSAYVEVTCPSTGHRHYLRVPPTVQTCEQAVAWTFGMDPEAYRPAVET